MQNKIRKDINPGVVSFISSLISILGGILLGYILLHIFKHDFANQGFINMITQGFKKADRFAKVLYTATPLMLTGLSVGFAFKTGLFNIGASGQFTMGAFFSLYAAIVWQMPWPVCLLLAILGGAIWGSIPGLFKALFNVNEVITSIMFNWIGLFTVNLAINNVPMMIAKYWGKINNDRTPPLGACNKSALMPKLGMDKLFNTNFINIGIFIAIIVAIIVWIILKKTTFGYELKACGYNRNACIYAGINAKKNIVTSMVIAGALSGLGGGIYFLSGTVQYNLVKEIIPMGFNGIPVALLASSHPLGTILSSLFISYIQVGGDVLQPEFAKEMIDIIIAAIIYISAFSLLMKGFIHRGILKLINKKEKDITVNAAGTVSNEKGAK